MILPYSLINSSGLFIDSLEYIDNDVIISFSSNLIHFISSLSFALGRTSIIKPNKRESEHPIQLLILEEKTLKISPLSVIDLYIYILHYSKEIRFSSWLRVIDTNEC